MKKLYLLSLFFLLCIFSHAQVSVTATAGTTGPTVYTTLQAAVASINNGVHQGAINIDITGSTFETLSTTFVASGKLFASYSSIVIRPATGISATITSNSAAPLLDFRGASNIVIDGINTGGSSLAISNSSISATASCITFGDGANNNTIQNCSLLGANPAANGGTVVFSTSLGLGNSNNKILNNSIADASTGTPANAIYAAGTVGAENSNNTISGNLIYNYYQPATVNVGILLAANNSGWTIQNNRLYQTSARVFTSGFIHRGIQITGGDGYTVSGNVIGAADAAGAGLYELAGTGVRFMGIEMNTGVIAPSNIQGNIVRSIQVTTTSGAGAPQGIFCGIYITGGNVNVGTAAGNVIGAAAGNGSIRIIPSTGGAVVTGITYNSGGIVNIANNTVGSIDLLPTLALSGNAFALQIVGAGATAEIKNNTLGGNSANSISIGVKGTTTGNGLIRGIFTNNNGRMTISNNLIQNLTHNSSNALSLFRAIECQVGTVSITGNTINNIAAEGASVSVATQEGIGILVSTAVPDILIDSNTISNLRLTNTGAIGTVLSGIYIGSLNTGARITRNNLFGFSNASSGTSLTAPSVAAGIYLRDVAAGELFVANNMIALGSSQATNTSFIGIWNQVNSAAGYDQKVYYNSIYIDGTVAAGTQPSFAYYRGNFTSTFTGPMLDIKNNIFVNKRSGGTGSHYAIANSYGAASSASGWPAGASDYNVLNADANSIGYWNTNQNFIDWKASSLSDNNSLSAVSVQFVDSSNNLHLVANANAAVDGRALPIAAVPTDLDNELRDGTTPDIGADEIFSALAVRLEFFRGQKQLGKNLLEWKINSNSTSVKFVIERSKNGSNFVEAGNVTGISFSRTFSFYDLAPAAGLNYYRLKMVEPDGSVFYSGVISFTSDIKNLEVGIRPNLVTNGTANLFTQSEKALLLTAKVIDVSGKVVLTKTVNIPAGTGTYPINVSTLTKGVYFISLSDGGRMLTQQIVVD